MRNGLRNLFRLYLDLVTDWRVYDASDVPPGRLLALGEGQSAEVIDRDRWELIVRQWGETGE